jgi:hypothetical protein
LVEGYECHIANLNLPDPDDRHVLAAAIEAGAETILTYNLRDFPAAVLATYGISALHPDEFLCRQMTEEPILVMEVVEKKRVKRKRPEISQEQLLSKLARLSIPEFVKMLLEAGSRLWKSGLKSRPVIASKCDNGARIHTAERESLFDSGAQAVRKCRHL